MQTCRASFNPKSEIHRSRLAGFAHRKPTHSETGVLARSHSRLKGFTLVELLVVITIIGVLISLLLPAVQAAREAARKMQCVNNFKQVGVAMHAYHAARSCFPPGTISTYALHSPCVAAPAGLPSGYCGWGWGTFVLPYMDQQAIYDMFDFRGDTFGYGSPGNPNNLVVCAKRLSVYICPSDPENGELINYTDASYSPSSGIPPHSPNPLEDLGMTNLVGIADSNNFFCSQYAFKQFGEADGVLANIGVCTASDIADGLSNTLMIGEATYDGPGQHQGRPWAFWAISSTGQGINGANTIPGGAQLSSYPGNSLYPNYWLSSYHPGGCNFLLADGSAHFLSQNIDQNLLRSLTTCAGKSSDGKPDIAEFVAF